MIILFSFLSILFILSFIPLLTLLIINLTKKKTYKKLLISNIIILTFAIINIILVIVFYQIDQKNKAEFYSGKSYELKDGSYEVGKDIKPGHYIIQSKHNTGYIEVKSTNKEWDFEETFGKDYGTPDSPTTPKLTTYLMDGDKVNLDKTKLTSFIPKHQERTTLLSTGVWVVGKDVPEGKYKIHMTHSHDIGGVFKIYNSDNSFDKEFILEGKEVDGLDDTKGEAELRDGQILVLNGMYSVTLDKE
ncbi:hypothetical protein [Staphylococcus pasteuri]|uniref:hypothetical protein n=1 Tax=Staphylococcus pasteuri TaxID=45972 RepID=UPI002DBF14A3|nr:hypothetical protein [Staphylococcus pasteuri]MEB7433359.1 hypothetical protein [Staphylococcus pasteuri]